MEASELLTPREIKALVEWIGQPPDECEHGFSPPGRCPNEGCPDKFVASAYRKLQGCASSGTEVEGK